MKKRGIALILGIMMLTCACSKAESGSSTAIDTEETVSEEVSETSEETQSNKVNISETPLNVVDDNYRTTYEVFVYSFCDSDGDGIGDLKGLIQKLDYINDGDDTTSTDLGCNEIWLMPVCPSTTYHKYDVMDYCDIDPEYGTMDDYRKLIEEAHNRGIRVINDMVMNHTSSQHPWFKEAADYLRGLSEGEEPDPEKCPYVDYYVFSKESQSGYEKLAGSDWYYEARFWSEMPDLNLRNVSVQNEFKDIAKFWLDAGCDGFRMDAVTSYTTNDTEKSTEELSVFVKNVKDINPDAYIVGEAWANSKTYSKFYESGIDSLFDFDFADSEGIVAKCARGKLSPIKYLQAQIDRDALYSSCNENYVDAPFYTNHDMARSAGYYTGKNAKTSTKFAGALNLLMSGNAFVYYGEELGMKGSGKDENKRAPMPWSSDEKAEGMCKGPSGMDNAKTPYGSLEEQAEDPDSIYNYYKAAIKLRNTYPAIGRGDVEILEGVSTDNSAVWIKSWNDADGEVSDTVMIAVNNSAEDITVDLSADTKADGFRKISDYLVTSSDSTKPSLNGDTLTVPSFGVVVLTKD